MSYDPDTRIPLEESVDMSLVAGSRDDQKDPFGPGAGQEVVFCCGDRYYRRLAKSSIICGASCIGIYALINSIEAEKALNRQEAEKFSRQAKKLSIISFVGLIGFIISLFLLMFLVSYLLTLQD